MSSKLFVCICIGILLPVFGFSKLPFRRIVAELEARKTFIEDFMPSHTSDCTFTDAAFSTWKKLNLSTPKGYGGANMLVVNDTPLDFTLGSEDCSDGAWTGGMQPEVQLQQKKAIIIGMEGTDFMRGPECRTMYVNEDADGSWFELEAITPFVGTNQAAARISDNLKAKLYKTEGFVNQVRLIVSCARENCL